MKQSTTGNSEEKEGLETVMELCRDFPEVKIIAISGGGPAEPGNILRMAQLLGALRTFTKPIVPAEFLLAVREIVGVK